MIDSNLVAAPEALPVCSTIAMRNGRMAELIAVFHAGWPMILIILARAFDALMEALALRTLQLRRLRCPGF